MSVNIKPWIDKIKKKLDSASSPEIMREVGNDVAARIKLRTRLGYGVKENGASKIQLKTMGQHSKPYAEWRRNNSGELSPDTAPRKHNLTMSGHMLDQLKVIKISPRKVEVGFTDNFALIKATVNQARGWKFLHLSNVEIKAVYNFYRRRVRDIVKAK